ncbi:SAM-dependent methyltransferase, partial [sediment metagenome]
PGDVLKEMKRVAQKRGKVVVIDVFTTSEEQSKAYNNIEKLRDPSHVHTLTLNSFQSLFKKAELINVTSKFYRVEIDLEQQIKASFPKKSDIPIIRKAALDDIGKDRLGWGAFLKERKVCLSLPIAVIAGEKA